MSVLLTHLPSDSATAKAIDAANEWTTTDYLIARVVDELTAANWMYASAHSEKAPDRPKAVPRPGQETAAANTFASASELSEALATVNRKG